MYETNQYRKWSDLDTETVGTVFIRNWVYGSHNLFRQRLGRLPVRVK